MPSKDFITNTFNNFINLEELYCDEYAHPIEENLKRIIKIKILECEFSERPMETKNLYPFVYSLENWINDIFVHVSQS